MTIAEIPLFRKFPEFRNFVVILCVIATSNTAEKYEILKFWMTFVASMYIQHFLHLPVTHCCQLSLIESETHSLWSFLTLKTLFHLHAFLLISLILIPKLYHWPMGVSLSTCFQSWQPCRSDIFFCKYN